jgi:neutral ceramidase
MRGRGAHRLAGVAALVAAGLAAGIGPGAVAPADADASALRAGAGRADITPPTGYYMMGWVRSDAAAEGQHTRLFARAIVLQRGGRKLALVAADLGSLPNGLVVHVAERLARRGFDQRNVIISASHTHSGPAGYFNYPAFNTVAPTSTTPTEFELASRADPELYSFLSRRLAASIRRADRDLAPAVAGWASGRLLGVTENRSIEAHLAGHGIIREFGEGEVGLDPLGYPDTINPHVDVLRVDKVARRGTVPIGIWSTFSNHGTVVKPSFTYYNADHHGAAARVAERRIRRLGAVPRGQEVVNAYGNTDEGDTTAGIAHGGPAGAERVGRRQARAMVRAWRRAGRGLERRPPLATRWTRQCFCARETAAGPVDDRAVVGMPFLTGSEENRGPLYDETGVPFEGYRNPVAVGPQGHKIGVVRDTGQFPTAVPLSAARVGDRAIVTVPGEMTSGMGRRLRAAVLRAARGSGIARVVISGLANDFVQYFASPQEYDRQHYEGGSTLFGRASGVFIEEQLALLVRRLVGGRPAPKPDPFDPKNGINDDAPPYGRGAAEAELLAQPAGIRRLQRAEFRWQGGERGLDRPLDRAFVIIERREGRRWRRVDSDLGLRILWSVDEDGRYAARWEAPLDTRLGRYRFRVTGNRYRLVSRPFRVRPSRQLTPTVARSRPGGAMIALAYPEPIENRDLTWRPPRAAGGRIVMRLDGQRVVVGTDERLFDIAARPGAEVVIRPGAARDRHGNRNARALRFRLGSP